MEREGPGGTDQGEGVCERADKTPGEWASQREVGPPLLPKRGRLYTYRGVVEEVVDGDTIWVRVDCGFRAWTRQKLRLRGIDAPEIPTVAGQRARAFVQQALSGVPFVVVTTTKPDKYDRYLSDVFYLPGGTGPQDTLNRGIFLNQQLLDRGLAVRFAE